MHQINEYHLLNHVTFPDFIVDLFNAKEKTADYIIWGKNGQRQNGIDIYSGSSNTAIQCKFKSDSNSKTKSQLKVEIQEEVKKVVESGVPIDRFILVSTFNHDAELQHFSLELKLENNYDFNINYIGWDELRKWALNHPSIIARYFGDFLNAEVVELVSINIDQDECSWKSKSGFESIFYKKENALSPHPVFDFTFINHFSKTIVLKSIDLYVSSIWSGFSGLSFPQKIESVHTYQMGFRYDHDNAFILDPPIQIGSEQAFRFKLQLLNQYQDECFEIKGRNVLFFSFNFSSNITVVAPKVYLNTTNENESFSLVELS